MEKTKQKDATKRESKRSYKVKPFLVIIKDNGFVHDKVGNIFNIKTTWSCVTPQNEVSIRQHTLRNILLNEKQVDLEEITDKVLMKQIKKSIKYGKGKVIHEEIRREI